MIRPLLRALACVLVVWTSAGAQTPEDAPRLREQLQTLLRSMEGAVRASDADAYLALVDRRDPEFAQEQKNWAADLKPHPPTLYELSLDDPSEGPSHEARALLTTGWRMGDGPRRSVTFLARFTHGESGWLYAGEAWTGVEGDRALALYLARRAGETAKDVARVLPGVRAHVHEGFEFGADEPLVSRTQKVKLYTSMAHLQHSIYLSYTDPLSGWNEPGEAIKILVREGGRPERTESLLAHEYGHVASFALGEKINDAPWWALEGIAELCAQRYSGSWFGADRSCRAWAKTDAITDWDKLADFKGEALKHQHAVYTQGHHMLGYITQRWGRPGRNAWLRALAQGKTLDEATRAALSMPFDQLDREWRASLVAPEK